MSPWTLGLLPMPLDTRPIANAPRHLACCHLAYCQCLANAPRHLACCHLAYCQCPSTLGLLPMPLDTWPIANVTRQPILSIYYWSGLLASPEVSNQLVRPAHSNNGVQSYSAFIANVRATMASQQAQPNTQDLFSPEWPNRTLALISLLQIL